MFLEDPDSIVKSYPTLQLCFKKTKFMINQSEDAAVFILERRVLDLDPSGLNTLTLQLELQQVIRYSQWPHLLLWVQVVL